VSDLTGQAWFDDQFSVCSHGLVKAYCASCTLEADRAKKTERREGRKRERELEATVGRQSEALDDAYAYIRNLERRQRQSSPRRRRLWR
jgi:hypothetical protein